MGKASKDSDEELELLGKRDEFQTYDDDVVNKEEPVGTVMFWQLFRFADTIDYVLLGFGLVACLITSICTVAYIVVYGLLAHAFASHSPILPVPDYEKLNQQFCPTGIVLTANNFANMSKFCGLTTPASAVGDGLTLREKVMPNIYILLIIGAIELFSGSLQCILFEFACRRQVNRIRVILFDCILRRDVSYFDTISNDSLNTHMIESVLIIEEAIGWEFSFVIADFLTLPALLITAFVVNWRMASILFIIGPFLIISLWFFGKVTGRAAYDELSSYRKANSVAEEALGSFRTVLSLNGIEFETKRYANYLSETINTGNRKGVAYGIFNGVLTFLVISVYAMLFYFGAKMSYAYPNKDFLKQYLIIITCVLESMMIAFQAGPFMESIAEATGAAISTWKIIDDSLNDQEVKKKARLSLNKSTPVMSRGEIVFKDVSFAYPKRSTKQVLSGLNFEAHPGKTIALVGSSGCGKSTCVQLLLRFYDITSGSITIDGNPIEEYDIKQLRQSIGVVSQEPVLFATTVYENIRYGNERATQSDIEEAARQANADSFIRKLPNKYATLVGERGAHLSGGEKQRIALARALVRKPTLLILDEATSALDYKNEAIVQKALNRACKDRTTIIIAHRLSTIRKADTIYVIRNGTCVESGNHDALIAQDGDYAKLYNKQTPTARDDSDEQDEEHSDPTEDEEEEKDEEDDSEDSALKKQRYDDEYEDDYRSERFAGQSWTAFVDILKLNKPEWPYIAAGCAASFVHGLIGIAITVLIGYSIKILQDYHITKDEKPLYYVCLLFYLTGLVSFMCEFVTGYCFIYSGSALIRRLRAKAFTSMLRQEVAWHDEPENHVGALCGRLSNEAMAIQKMTNIHLGMLLEAIGNWGIGLIFGLIVCWQLTLVVASYIVLICILAVFEIRWSTNIYRQIEEFLEQFSALSLEALENIRTIKQLTLEETYVARYQKMVYKLIRICRFYDFVSSLIRAFDMAALTFVVCALYFAALSMHEHGLLKSANMIYAFGLVLYCMSASEAVTNMQTEWGETSMAAQDFVHLFERDPEIDNLDKTNGQVIPDFSGNIEFYRVQFSYPTRPDRLILNHFHLSIDSGQRVAIVGPSGSGKTSIIQLLERFYDADKGEVRVDGEDIRTVNLHWLRSQIGLVSQEPVLFDMSIRDNITYGLTSYTEQEVTDSAKKANIHELIQSLPKGYHTNVGIRGTQLSGGEKQRIAIARILIRRPRILLFDEATSAMDSYNEQIVQDALDRAAETDDGEKRTTITIAHRLSTIESSDMIIVLDAQGLLAERPGTHEELISRFGPYYHMQANRAI